MKKTLEKKEKEELFKVFQFSIYDKFIIENDLLFYLESSSKLKSRRILRFCLPFSFITSIFYQSHSLPIKGHMGWHRTWEEISKHYYYPNLYSLTHNLFISCHICLTNKVTKHHNQPLQSFTVSEPFEVLEIDHIIVGSTSTNGYNYILTVVDKFSLKNWFLPVKT